MSPRARHASWLRTSGWLALLLSAIVVVACGNGNDEEAGSATEPPDTSAAADAAATESADGASSAPDDASVPDAIAGLASETGAATVTVGEETYEFSLAGTTTIEGTTYVGRCQTIFGMIAASGFATDGRDITVDMEVPPVDWETYEDDRYDPPTIRVEDNEGNANWVANASDSFVSGSGVGEFAQDEGSASGTATFVNAWDAESGPVEGTFELDCAA